MEHLREKRQHQIVILQPLLVRDLNRLKPYGGSHRLRPCFANSELAAGYSPAEQHYTNTRKNLLWCLP